MSTANGRGLPPGFDLSGLLNPVAEIAAQAGERTLDFFRTELDVHRKEDYSPVTEADRAADQIIVPALQSLTPNIPVVSEERFNDGQHGDVFWLVDPLDGTKEFINERDEFTVNIALISDRKPVLGVIGRPTDGSLYLGAGMETAELRKDGQKTSIACRMVQEEALIIATSRSHRNSDALEDFLKDKVVAEQIKAGSSLKFCLVAEARADIYPRFAPTMEWDTAAGQAIVEAAGGSVCTWDDEPLLYNKEDFRNPHFIVRGRRA